MMRVLVTGHLGYFGSVLSSMLRRAGYDVTGLDCDFYRGCDFNAGREDIPSLLTDVRDVEVADLRGFDAVIHLAALPEDWSGRLDPDLIEQINFEATMRLACCARQAGVSRFLFASSCAVYGREGGTPCREDGSVEPLTPYASAKLRCEREIARLADDGFTPVFLRNATLYGPSPRMRLDTVVNDFAAAAVTRGRIAMMTEGRAWRPVLHVDDASRAYVEVLGAAGPMVRNRVYNVAHSDENFRVIEIADAIAEQIALCARAANRGVYDARSYRADGARIAADFPDLAMRWRLHGSIGPLNAAIESAGVTAADWRCDRFRRVLRLQHLMEAGRLDADLRPVAGRPVRPVREAVLCGR